MEQQMRSNNIFFLGSPDAQQRLQEHSHVSASVMTDLVYTKQQLNRLVDSHAEEVSLRKLHLVLIKLIHPVPRSCNTSGPCMRRARTN